MLMDDCNDSHHPANSDDARTFAVIITDYFTVVKRPRRRVYALNSCMIPLILEMLDICMRLCHGSVKMVAKKSVFKTKHYAGWPALQDDTMLPDVPLQRLEAPAHVSIAVQGLVDTLVADLSTQPPTDLLAPQLFEFKTRFKHRLMHRTFPYLQGETLSASSGSAV